MVTFLSDIIFDILWQIVLSLLKYGIFCALEKNGGYFLS